MKWKFPFHKETIPVRKEFRIGTYIFCLVLPRRQRTNIQRTINKSKSNVMKITNHRQNSTWIS